MEKYKIVFVDIDDTLNVRNKEITEKTKDVMKKLKEKGITVVINTGRSLEYAIDRSKTANLSQYVVSSNGSEVYDYKNKKIIFSKNIPKDTVRKIYEYSKSANLFVILDSYEKKFKNTEVDITGKSPAYLFHDIEEVLKDNEITQIILVSNNFERMKIIPELFKEKYSDVHVVYSSREIIENQRNTKKYYSHDIVANNISKSTGIVELLDYLNIDPEESIAIGDDVVDIPMFDVVNLKIAVVDGSKQLTSKADILCPSAKEDGVATILEKLFLS